MRYFINPDSQEIFAYVSFEEAKEFNKDFQVLEEVNVTVVKSRPSRHHHYEGGEWVISSRNQNIKTKNENDSLIKQKSLALSELRQDMQMHILLDETVEAKAIAQQIKSLKTEIEQLESEISVLEAEIENGEGGE